MPEKEKKVIFQFYRCFQNSAWRITLGSYSDAKYYFYSIDFEHELLNLLDQYPFLPHALKKLITTITFSYWNISILGKELENKYIQLLTLHHSSYIQCKP